MELEYRDNRHRGKFIIIVGLILAVAAGGAAFVLINRAQQEAASTGVMTTRAVVATRVIPARKAIEAADLVVRDVPLDDMTSQGIVDDPARITGAIPAVTILAGQLVTTNLLTSAGQSGPFAILGPEETVAPDSPYWRAVSLTVPDDRAVGGMLQVGQTVDVFVTATVNVPASLMEAGRYYTDKTTKITYQDMTILAKSGSFYIVRAGLNVAEEIAHLQATGTAQFSMVLRPTEDTRIADASGLGETTNLIITRYGLPIPETYPSGRGPVILPGTGEGQPTPSDGGTDEPTTSPEPSPTG